MPIERGALLQAFLTGTRWAPAHRAPLAGDASRRRYERLRLPDGESAVLMDAPPETGEDIGPFLAVSEILTQAGLSAPRTLAADTERGFLLLEDLGDDLYTHVLVADPEHERHLYLAAVDVLLALRTLTPVGFPDYDAATMTRLSELAFTWYADGHPDRGMGFCAELKTRLELICGDTVGLALRDFHADNLLWLPERQGLERVGLLDFQDAALCHPAYDLVSLLEDARRDVSAGTRSAAFAHYLAETGESPEAFGAAFAVLGLQRNLRILGVFARLSLRDGKPGYINLIPRVWAHLKGDAAHPALADLANQLFAVLPAPDAAHLERLKNECGTIPTR